MKIMFRKLVAMLAILGVLGWTVAPCGSPKYERLSGRNRSAVPSRTSLTVGGSHEKASASSARRCHPACRLVAKANVDFPA